MGKFKEQDVITFKDQKHLYDENDNKSVTFSKNFKAIIKTIDGFNNKIKFEILEGKMKWSHFTDLNNSKRKKGYKSGWMKDSNFKLYPKYIPLYKIY